MNNYEKIPCFIRYVNCKVACVCKRTKEKIYCAEEHGCEKEPLLRDRYYGWKEAFRNEEKNGKGV